MLSKTLEFLRIVDIAPPHDKVSSRARAAKALLAALLQKDDAELLLPCIQGVVAGFDCTLFTQGSPVVVSTFGAIHELDLTLPSALAENALELRAVAAIALGELLSSHATADEAAATKALLAATALISSLTCRPPASETHLRPVLETLLSLSAQLLNGLGSGRRRRKSAALHDFNSMEEPEESTWQEVFEAVKPVLDEFRLNQEIDREELETLWWLFAAYSDIENKPLDQMKAGQAALASGVELARKSLIPASLSSAGMVKRASEAGRKPEEIGPTKLQDLVDHWTAGLNDSLTSSFLPIENLAATYPVLVPVIATCSRILKEGKSTKLFKELKPLTGFASGMQFTPTECGQQVFREAILQRMLAALVS